MISYTEACERDELFGPWFRGESWAAWRAVGKAAFGEMLTADELLIYEQLSGGAPPPDEPVREAWLCFGRRGGKDVRAASIVTYIATVGAEAHSIRNHLVPGERGVVQLLAVDRPQAEIAMGYVKAMLQRPLLTDLVIRSTANGIDLANDISIEITTNDKRRVRGRTVIATILDEVAFWPTSIDGQESEDEATYSALAPAMATIPSAMLIGISSPYARRGLFWRKFKEHYGKAPHDRVVFLKAPTWTMNPTLPKECRVIVEAYAKDASWAEAEFGAEFRSDLESFVSREVVEAAVDVGIRERGPIPGTKYAAFVDPAGGSGQDSMTLAISHRDHDTAVLDVVREVRPPFSPEDVVADFVRLLKAYKVRKIEGDRWGGEFVREPFKKAGINYETSAEPKTDIYREFLPLLNSGRVRLLDEPRLHGQLISLERRVARGGRDSIDHPPNGHDDVANATAGSLYLASRRRASTYTDALMRPGTLYGLRPEEERKQA